MARKARKKYLKYEGVESLLEDLKSGLHYRVKGLVSDALRESMNRINSGLKLLVERGPAASISGISPKFLPKGVKLVMQRGSRTIFVIEEPPQTRTIHFQRNFTEQHFHGSRYDGALDYRIHPANIYFRGKPKPAMKRHFRLAFPYVIFIICLDNGYEFDEKYSCHMFFSNEPFTKLNQPLFHSCLPNVNHDGYVCGGKIKAEIRRLIRQVKYSQAVEAIIDHVWNGTFNQDIVHQFLKTVKQDKRLRSLWHWEEQSEKDPLFMLNVEWCRVDFRDYGYLDFLGRLEDLLYLNVNNGEYDSVKTITNAEAFCCAETEAKIRQELERMFKKFKDAIDRGEYGGCRW